MTQRERIAAGMLYTDMGEGLPEERMRGKELAYDFNATRPSEEEKRQQIMKQLFGKVGESVWIEPPLRVAYGRNVFIGNEVYINFNLTLVDDFTIQIGDRVLIAPSVIISTSGHPVDPEIRGTGQQFSLPVVIENDVWIGSGVVINPGVTIGEGSVIGAGSVVTKDIPPGVVAMGVPCRVVRKITEQDKEYYYKNKKVE